MDQTLTKSNDYYLYVVVFTKLALDWNYDSILQTVIMLRSYIVIPNNLFIQ